MMVAIFTLLLASFLLAWFRYQRAAVIIFILTLIFAISLFLFEIYSPITGFHMPWIQT